MPSKYASETRVPVERSRAEIEALLIAHGAVEFVYGRDESRRQVHIGFKVGTRRYRYTLHLPDPAARQFTHSPGKNVYTQRERTPQQIQAAYDQAVRSAWRELVLLIKAKLVATSSGIVKIEDEFLAWAVGPDGRTLGEWLAPQLDDALRAGRLPPLLPGPRED